MKKKALRQLTVRGFDEPLRRRLEDVARETGTSLNRAAIVLMRRGAGLDRPARVSNAIGDALDAFIGVLTEDEAKEIVDSIASLEAIDESLWR